MFRLKSYFQQIRGRHIGWGIIGTLLVYKSLTVASRYEYKPQILSADTIFDWCWLMIYLWTILIICATVLGTVLVLLSLACEAIQNHHEKWIEWINQQFDKLFGV